MIAKLISYFIGKHSTERIANVLGKFDTLITELEDATLQGGVEIDAHREAIEMLQRQVSIKQENINVINKAQLRAGRVAQNLKALIGG